MVGGFTDFWLDFPQNKADFLYFLISTVVGSELIFLSFGVRVYVL